MASTHSLKLFLQPLTVGIPGSWLWKNDVTWTTLRCRSDCEESLNYRAEETSRKLDAASAVSNRSWKEEQKGIIYKFVALLSFSYFLRQNSAVKITRSNSKSQPSAPNRWEFSFWYLKGCLENHWGILIPSTSTAYSGLWCLPNMTIKMVVWPLENRQSKTAALVPPLVFRNTVQQHWRDSALP